MNFLEFTDKFKKQVDSLSYERQFDLALRVCKKLFFDYQHFFDINEWGNPDILLDALNLLEHGKLEKPDTETLKAMLEKIEAATPDSEDFGEANFAINASGAVYETIQFVIDKRSEHIYNIGSYLIDTVDAKVQGDDDLSEAEINQHALMVDAMAYLLRGTQ